MVGPYSLDITATQNSIESFLKAQYPHVPVIPDGLLDVNHEAIQRFPDQSIKPFIVLWFSTVKRRPRGRSFASYKLDQHFATVDVVVVARHGTECRKLLNNVSDRLVEFQATGGGKMYKSASLWGSSRKIDIQNSPTRFAMTDRFDFGVSAQKIV